MKEAKDYLDTVMESKINAIRYICESVLKDDTLIYNKSTTVSILKSILEVCNG